MSIIKQIHQDHLGLAETMKKHLGIRKIVEDLYPKQAHFIYELLQNAEDCEATEVSFELTKSSLVFEHNGRTFDQKDIRSITDIGDGTKGSDDTKIGQFGIGFKAVFGYSETPRIYSPTFNFEIHDLVLPKEIAPSNKTRTDRTRFEFPLNSPKKTPKEAFEEIETGLKGVNQETLLFLKNINSIKWVSESGSCSELIRKEYDAHHIEVGKITKNRGLKSHNYLRFSKEVPEAPDLEVSIAFRLKSKSENQDDYNTEESLNRFEIEPIQSGKVFVYFPAEKEVSGLRFHINGPFIPELSRASIKETSANKPLYRAAATLACEALRTIRSQQLLNKSILEVLPNNKDTLGSNYEVIRARILKTLNTEALTPTYDGDHAPARKLLQANVNLKRILAKEDLDFLFAISRPTANWATGAMNNSHSANLLESLDIRHVETEDLVKLLKINANTAWFKSRTNNWVRQLYEYLGATLKRGYFTFMGGYEGEALKYIPFIRLSTGKLACASECYFPTEETLEDALLPRIHHETYGFNEKLKRQDHARKFLEDLGVREVNEVDRIEAILETNYGENHKLAQPSDIQIFIDFLKKHPDEVGIFQDYNILKGSHGKWVSAHKIILDAPFLQTGLAQYYKRLGKRTAATTLSDEYTRLGIPLDKIVDLAEQLGAHRHIRICNVKCNSNPEWNALRQATGSSITDKGRDWDHTLDGFDQISGEMSEASAVLIWQTLDAYQQKQLNFNGPPFKAYFQRNASGSLKTADAQIIHQLRNAAWVPQTTGNFVRPRDADPNKLPPDFSFDKKWPWIEAVGFAEKLFHNSELERQQEKFLSKVGLADKEARKDAIAFAKLPREQRRQLLHTAEEYQAKKDIELPEKTSKNPERRTQLVQEAANAAPERESVIRDRSVSLNRDSIKTEAGEYLRENYINDDGIMICQICKGELPFQLANGQYYFESHELISKDYLRKHHKENYITLCPNHGAMLKHINQSEDEMKELVKNATENEITVILGEEEHNIYFTKTHLHDLQSVIEADEESVSDAQEPNGYNS